MMSLDYEYHGGGGFPDAKRANIVSAQRMESVTAPEGSTLLGCGQRTWPRFGSQKLSFLLACRFC